MYQQSYIIIKKIVLQEHPTDVLDWASAVDNDKLVIHYIRDVKVT